MCFFKNLTVTFLFVSPVEISIVFPPAKHAIHNAVSLKAFGRKWEQAQSSWDTRSKDLHLFIDRDFRAAVPNLVSRVP